MEQHSRNQDLRYHEESEERGGQEEEQRSIVHNLSIEFYSIKWTSTQWDRLQASVPFAF
jgi:hypothetical protein